MPGIYNDTGTLATALLSDNNQAARVLIGYMTAFNSTTFQNTVTVLVPNTLTDVPILASAAATISVPCSVLMLKFGANYVVLGRLRVP